MNEQALLDGWSLYLTTKQEAETAKIGAALRSISVTHKRVQLRFNGKQIRYRRIDVHHLLNWADTHNIGDRETMLAAVVEPVTEPRSTFN